MFFFGLGSFALFGSGSLGCCCGILNHSADCIFYLGHALGCINCSINVRFRNKYHTEFVFKLLILDILCRRNGYDDLTQLLQCLEYKECSCRLKDTCLLDIYRKSDDVLAVLLGSFDNIRLLFGQCDVLPLVAAVR